MRAVVLSLALLTTAFLARADETFAWTYDLGGYAELFAGSCLAAGGGGEATSSAAIAAAKACFVAAVPDPCSGSALAWIDTHPTATLWQSIPSCDGASGIGVIANIIPSGAGPCAAESGKFRNFRHSVYGDVGVAKGSWSTSDLRAEERLIVGATLCLSSCQARPTQVTCSVVPKDDDGDHIVCDGVAMFNIASPTSCTAGVGGMRAAVATGLTETIASPVAGQNPAGVSGGGKGTGDAQTDLAKIATNTDRIARSLESGGVGTGDGSGGGGTGGSCGGVDQPKCVIDEGNTATSDDNTAANMGGNKTAMEADMSGVATSLSASTAPGFLPGEGRWVFSFSSLLPDANCEAPIALGIFGTEPLTLSVCSWGAQVRDFLGWAMVLMTGLGIWLTVFRS